MPMSTTDGRIATTFSRLRGGKTPGLVTYVTAGDPDLPRTAGILRALDRAGADVLEIGVPFSDPLADGPVVDLATRGRIMTLLEAGRGSEAEALLDERYRLYAPLDEAERQGPGMADA